MHKQNDHGVHASHCCAVHGCKYGDKDCPVVAGTVNAKADGEYCLEERREFREDIRLILDDPRQRDLFMPELQDVNNVARAAFLRRKEIATGRAGVKGEELERQLQRLISLAQRYDYTAMADCLRAMAGIEERIQPRFTLLDVVYTREDRSQEIYPVAVETNGRAIDYVSFIALEALIGTQFDLNKGESLGQFWRSREKGAAHLSGHTLELGADYTGMCVVSGTDFLDSVEAEELEDITPELEALGAHLDAGQWDGLIPGAGYRYAAAHQGLHSDNPAAVVDALGEILGFKDLLTRHELEDMAESLRNQGEFMGTISDEKHFWKFILRPHDQYALVSKDGDERAVFFTVPI